MTRLSHIAISIGFLCAIYTQALLVIAGVESLSVQSDLATPRGSLGPEELLDSGGLDQLSAFLDDRLPYRDRASRLTNDIDRLVLRDESRQESRDTVVFGRDGWLFQSDSFTAFCDVSAPAMEVIVARAAEIIDSVEDRGTHVLLTVAPDKRTIRPDRIDVPERFACEEPSRSRLRAALAEFEGDWFVDLWTPLLEARQAGAEVYRQRDTHWDGIGAVTLVSELAAAIPFTAELNVVDKGTEVLAGDLTRVLGIQSLDVVPLFQIENDGATVHSVVELIPERPGLIRRVQSGGADEMVEGRTVVILDSFGETALDSFQEIFSDVTFVAWKAFEEPEARRTVAEADLLILQTVEREAPRNLRDRLPRLVPTGTG